MACLGSCYKSISALQVVDAGGEKLDADEHSPARPLRWPILVQLNTHHCGSTVLSGNNGSR